jgi:hypothetical protein
MVRIRYAMLALLYVVVGAGLAYVIAETGIGTLWTVRSDKFSTLKGSRYRASLRAILSPQMYQ